MIDERLLEIRRYDGAGYQPLIDYGNWRVAILRYIDSLLPEQIDTMQRHDETDEVFVLLAGHCILFLGEGSETLTTLHAVNMKPLVLYNIKRGVWHTHTLSPDATVLIIENVDTTTANSPFSPLNAAQKAELIRMTQALW